MANNAHAPCSMLNPLQERSIASETQSTFQDKAIVVGLYGLSASGKTFLLTLLKQGLGKTHFAFFEGSSMLDALIPGGL